MKKYIIVVNPRSGKKKGLRILDDIKPILNKSKINFEICNTEYRGHAQQIIQTLTLSDYDGVVIVGGDGTFHEAVNGMLKRNDNKRIPIGIIPAGTGNSFLLDLNITNTAKAIDNIITGKTKKIDILKIIYEKELKYSINLVGWGMITDVGLTSEKFRFLGYSRYTIAAIVEILFKKSRYATIEIDDTVLKDRFMFAIACNSKHVGKGMIMAPEAELDDGFMDVIIADGDISRFRLLNVLPKLFEGTHINEPEVKSFKSKKIKLISKNRDQLNIDGEMVGESPFEVEVLEKEIEIFN
tara:strand:+ start:14025 stop:14915 length:891 start_codon:yes stop_codon:yes gene_type:complete